MKIQGWNSLLIPQVTETGIFSSIKRSLPIHREASIDEDPLPSLSPSDVRSELLAKIKLKIKSGYYNNESVIDDIGYGFAQAIDNSL